MKTILTQSKLRDSKHGLHRLVAGVVGLILVSFTGCSFLKPAQSVTRHFVLSSIATNAPTASQTPLALGVGPVKLPAYLFNTPLATRISKEEVEYQSAADWAERLDAGFQRVLAANLAMLLGTDRIYLSTWQKSDVTAELHVIIEQFDVDATGRGQLLARWRIVSPASERVLKSGTSRLERTGPAPDRDAGGSVATLSALVADFSGEMVGALRESSVQKP